MSIYDEGVCEKEIGTGSLEDFTQMMVEVPAWGAGLPVKAKGWVGKRYRK
jgi:DNA polymerase